MQECNISSALTVNGNIDQAQFEADKRAVYKHPLFSLLALLLEKCEQATQGYIVSSSSNSSTSSPNATSNNSNGEGDSFSKDIQAFVQLLEKEKRPLLTNNSELDGLMIKALQVLRIHLLELEKVQELCRDFCTRYIACLRGKMQSENLLRSDYPLETINNLSNSNSPINCPDQDQISSQSNYFASNDFIANNLEPKEFNSTPAGGFNLLPSNNVIAEMNYNSNSSNDINANTIPSVSGIIAAANSQQSQNQTQTQSTAQTSQNSTTAASTFSSSQILGSTPLIQIGCLPLDQYSGKMSPSGSSDEIDSELDSNNDDLSSNFSNTSGSKRQKRGILPKQATSVMRAWLFQHLVHPYPTEDEKRSIASQTNLTLLQVNNWFINARRRILQPMLENANDTGSNQSRKKLPQNSSSNNVISKRFWSDSLPSTQAMLDSTNIENISANVNRADMDRLSSSAQDKMEENFYSSDESNDSLVIDHN